LIVVSNSSPLIALSAVGRFDILHELYGDLLTKAGFRVSEALYRRVLEEGGEVASESS